MTTPTIILASSSQYRRALLDRLGLNYRALAPDVDESAQPGEAPAALTERLAQAKAQAMAEQYPDSLIIGSDQVVSLDGHMLGKPGGHQAAIAQLERLSGRQACFLTGLCLLNTATGQMQSHCDAFWVWFRQLSAAKIATYVERERPYDCAGAFKSEGLGIALFTRLQGEDPNSLIGLPLIRLITMLEQEGVDVLMD
ncbi:Maf family protein [Rhabdochromatium marinum]|uniref:Maf family protein n=1 Tax=Rhabdochromatium marinum TaxID=48729 RepID=UPI0019046CA2|nr:nucleoside triphosphate pyrophosphatase [Rhabdochromatium marinum]MBK1650016.1 septum formation inhibitor Maf [Rhabdochromatium marinum]